MTKPGSKQESPIAASAEAKAILSRLAEELGLPKIALLDEALRALRDYYDHHNQRLLLPLRFQETFRVVTLPTPKRDFIADPLSVEEQQALQERHAARTSKKSKQQ